jgi:hypothetical protein
MSAQKPWLDRRGRPKKRPTIDQFADVLAADLAPASMSGTRRAGTRLPNVPRTYPMRSDGV